MHVRILPSIYKSYFAGNAAVNGAETAATKTGETVGAGIDALKSAINTLGVAVADLADKIATAEKKEGEQTETTEESVNKVEVSPSEVEKAENEKVPADEASENKEEVIPPPVQASESQAPQLSDDQEVVDKVGETVEKVTVEEEKKEEQKEEQKEDEDIQTEGIKNIILNTAQNLVGLLTESAGEKKEATPPIVDNAGEDVPTPKVVNSLTAESTNPFDHADEGEVVQREEIYREQEEVQQEAPQNVEYPQVPAENVEYPKLEEHNAPLAATDEVTLEDIQAIQGENEEDLSVSESLNSSEKERRGILGKVSHGVGFGIGAVVGGVAKVGKSREYLADSFCHITTLQNNDTLWTYDFALRVPKNSKIPYQDQFFVFIILLFSVTGTGKAVGHGVKAGAGAVADGTKAVGHGVASGTKAVAGAVADGGKAVGHGVAAGTKAVAGVVADGGKAVGHGVATGTKAVVGGVTGTASAIGHATVDVAKDIGGATKAVAGGVVDGTKAVAGGIADGTKAVVGGVVDGTKAVGKGIADGTKAVAGGFVDGISDGSKTGAEAVKAAPRAVADTATAFGAATVDAVKDVGAATKAGAGAVVDGTKAVAGGVVDGTKAVAGGIADGTKAVVGGVADGTKAVVGGVVDGAKAVGGGFVEGVSDGNKAIKGKKDSDSLKSKDSDSLKTASDSGIVENA